MKKYLSAAGSIALAFALSGMPAALAHAENGGGESEGTAVRVTVGEDVSGASTTMRVQREKEGKLEDQAEATSSESAREASKQQNEQVREQAKQTGEQVREAIKNRIELIRESTTTPAFSIGQLRQMIQERRQELDDEEASTTPEFKDVVKNANEVRLAVHTLLASKDLLGGIGPEVSQIAQHVNDSIATTTNAEAQIESRGFWSKLFFGGDTTAANTITNEVQQNQQNIAKIADLLNQASTTADVKATLAEQITAMQAQITRLQSIAASQAKLWGLFSWRF